MKTFLIALFVLSSLSCYAQPDDNWIHTLPSYQSNTNSNLCFFKRVALKDYAYANILGTCPSKQSMNGIWLSIVAVSNDPSEIANTADFGQVRSIRDFKNINKEVEISVVQDRLNAKGEVVTTNEVIYLKTLNRGNGTFYLKQK